MEPNKDKTTSGLMINPQLKFTMTIARIIPGLLETGGKITSCIYYECLKPLLNMRHSGQNQTRYRWTLNMPTRPFGRHSICPGFCCYILHCCWIFERISKPPITFNTMFIDSDVTLRWQTYFDWSLSHHPGFFLCHSMQPPGQPPSVPHLHNRLAQPGRANRVAMWAVMAAMGTGHPIDGEIHHVCIMACTLW